MADLTLTAQLRLGGYDRRFADTALTERADLALISLACPLGGDAALARALDQSLGLARPGPRRAETAGAAAALQMTPDQIMLVLPEDAAPPDLSDAAYTTLQTDAWVILDLAGPLARPALKRLCPLDLDPAAFPVGAFGRTLMAHMGVLVWRTAPESYRLMSASSSAESFLHAVETSLVYTGPPTRTA